MDFELGSETMHPAKALSVIYFDGPAQMDGKVKQLTGYGAFEVTIEIPGEPVFRSHHVMTWDNERRYGLIGDLAALSDGRHVVIGSPDAYEDFWDRRHILTSGTRYIEAVRPVEIYQPSGLTLNGNHEISIAQLADTFGLPNCRKSDLVGQAMVARERSQLIWLAYVATVMGEWEVQNMFAGFQAWRAIQNSMPIPF